YTNPEGDYDNNELTPFTPYLTFSKAVIKKLSAGSYEYSLYIGEDDAWKISNSDLKFSLATITDINTTSINSIESIIG
ncbi:MAG: hypothetical protein WCS80_04335, partial [Bacilli bacterium]